VLYRDSPLRWEALASPPGAPQRYSLYGLDELATSAFDVHHNLEPPAAARVGSRLASTVLDRGVLAAGGYSGDFAKVLPVRRVLNDADVVFSTVDTVGIPLVLLAGARLVRTPIVYAAIGLPERIEQLGARAEQAYSAAFRRIPAIVAYGWAEVRALREWLGDGSRVHFIPFGVDTKAFRPVRARADTDVVSVGGDPHRDYALLLALAERRPEWSFRIVASRDHAMTLGRAPRNVQVELDLPFDLTLARLEHARVVVLPVQDNSYSGATTVLLQAMAMGKPVVVTRTDAIASGYHLDSGANCRLVPPGDEFAFGHALDGLLDDPSTARAMGDAARRTAERHLSWDAYVDAMLRVLEACRA
jgi:glycosyltransferase involved in cell wall biosynthesis